MHFDDVQRLAVNRMKSGSILVGGTGSGKSRTALAYYYIRELGGSMTFHDGMAEIQNLVDTTVPLYIITTAAKRDKKEWDKELIPFSLSAKVDSWNNITKYVEVRDAFFIFDEQRVIGSGAWSKSFIKISKNNHWILLTATPGDVWSDYIPVFIANGFYKNRTQFCARHVVWSRFTTYPKIEKYLETDHLEKLRESIQITMDVKRRTVPHRIDIITSYDKELYNIIFKDRWNPFDDTPIENASQYTFCLRRVVNSNNSKIEKLKTILEDHKKLIIFYNFNYELDALREFAQGIGIDMGEWNGQLHQQIPETDSWLYLVQYNAGAEGWNCVATNTMVFFSLNHSYRMTHQAAGRIDRRNTQFTDLNYYYLYSDSSIDRSILKALKEKKDFNEKNFYEKSTSQKLQSLL